MDFRLLIQELDRIVEQTPTANTQANTSTTSTGIEPSPQEKAQMAKQAQGLQAFKSSVSNPASPQDIAQSLEKASKGQGISGTDAKILNPYMDVLAKVAKDPNLSNTFKTLINQARNVK